MRRFTSNHFCEVLIVLGIVLSAMFLSTPRLVSQYMHRPSGSVFVGMTDYFEDFYYYLDQFYQGAHGKWLTENHFSIEHFSPTIIYFDNIMFGKIGGMFGLESFQSYNVFAQICKFLFLIAAFLWVRRFYPTSRFRRISVYLIFLFSTGLPNFSLKYGQFSASVPIDLFRSENRFLARFGDSPGGMFTNFLFIAVFLALIRFFSKEFTNDHATGSKNWFGVRPDMFRNISVSVSLVCIFFLFTLLAVSDVAMAAVFLATFWILYLIFSYRHRSFAVFPIMNAMLMLFTIVFIAVALFTYKMIMADPVYVQATQWDISQYLQVIKGAWKTNFIRGCGFQIPLFMYGYWILLKKEKRTALEDSALVFSGIGFFGYVLPIIFQIPIPGFRAISSAQYVPIAVIVWVGLEELSKSFRMKNMKIVLLMVYLAINIIAFIPDWYKESRVLKEPDYHFAYLPEDIYKGFVYLRTAQPLDGNVLASPYTSTDLMIPGIGGRYTYSGHFLTTFNSKAKDVLANKFFYEWNDQPEAHKFLKDNNIRFIVVTEYAGVLDRFKTNYPFLKVAFANSMITVFRYDE